MKKLLFFDAINVDGPKKKILEFNTESQLAHTDVDLLESLSELIKNKAMYHSSKVSKHGFELIKKLLTKFPADKAFPCLDFYRMFLMHPNSSENFKVFETGFEYLGHLLGYLRDDKSPETTQLLTLRCLVNMFNNSPSSYMMLSKR